MNTAAELSWNIAVQLVECLYNRSAFQGFRRPVTSMYPSLLMTYTASIKEPMDLGSLLLFLKVCQTSSPANVVEKLTAIFPESSDFVLISSNFPSTDISFFQWLREKIQLISSNSLQFNMGSPAMEAISTHLDICAGALFESAFFYPYKSSSEMNTSSMQSSILQSSIKRYLLIQNMPLMLSELELLTEKLKSFESEIFDEAIRMTSIEVQKVIRANQSGSILRRSTALLKDFLSTIPEFAIPHDHYSVDTQDVTYVVLMGLSTLLILLEERFLRGITYSCIWARPAETFVWARPSHSSSRDASLRPRVNWFPGMVIAASYTACLNGTAGLAPDVVLSNLSRIPADLQAELLKIRPRPIHSASKKKEEASEEAESEGESESAPSGSSVVGLEETWFCPDGFLLVEFFGLHDFGWVRADSTAPLYLVELKTVPGAAPVADDPSKSTPTATESLPPPEDETSSSQVAVTEFSPSTNTNTVPKQDPRLSVPCLKMSLNPPPVAASKLSNKESLEEAKQAIVWWMYYRNSLMNPSGTSKIETAISDDVLMEALASLPTFLAMQGDSDLQTAPTVEQLQSSLQQSAEDEQSSSENDAAGGSFSCFVLPECAQVLPPPSTSSSTRRRRSSEGISSAVNHGADPDVFHASSTKRRRASQSVSATSSSSSSSSALAPTSSGSADSPGRTLEEVFLASVDYSRCIEGSSFYVSRIPSLDSILHSALKSGWTVSARQSLCNTRNKAILVTRAAVHWMEKVRPLHLMCTAPPAPSLPPSKSSNNSGAISTRRSTAIPEKAEKVKPVEVEVKVEKEKPPASTSPVTTAVVLPPPKRKYVFKNRIPAAASNAEKAKSSAAHPTSATAAAVAAMTASNYLNVTPYVAAVAFVLDAEAGCSKFLSGEGVVYTRTVNAKAAIFHREHRSREARKKILREELQRIERAVEVLQDAAKKREQVVPPSSPIPSSSSKAARATARA